MTIEASLVQELKDNATLAAFVDDGAGGSNIFPNYVPDNSLEQYDNFITYTNISSRYVQDVAVEISQWQINCISKDMATALDMWAEVFETLQRLKKTDLGSGLIKRAILFSWTTDKRTTFDETTKLYNVQADFTIKYQEE